jgi:dTDP-4-amino-4,6-dideoxygalactose transaminase
VLTPTFTFFASASCIARLGAKPVFVDMDPDTFNMDISEAERRMTKKTKGIIPVHLFLQCCDMEHITRLAKNNGLKVLEDAAESWGMRTSVGGHSRMAGTIGDIGIYSFFPTKTLGAYGDAGLMVTNDERLYQQIKSYRVHGTKIKYHHDYIGYNSRLDTIQAAILTVKIQYSHDSIKMRAKHAEHYTSLLKDVSGIRFPKIKNINEPVYYVYNLLVENRDKLAEHLKAKGIGYSVYYPIPLHLQKCFSYLGHQRGDFPVAEKTCDEIIALPMFPELKEEEVEYTAETIKAFYRKGK